MKLKKNINYSFVCLIIAFGMIAPVIAEEKVPAYELLYNEQETGTDVYAVRFIITGRYLRIDDQSDDSGYILFDKDKTTIYSVSHFDQSTLVIPEYDYKKPDMETKVEMMYEPLTTAPKISGKTVYTYRVNSKAGAEDVCVDIQLVPGLLPEVTQTLRAYQKVVTGQQAKTLKNTPEEFKTTCFLYDQIFNDGEYYEKGLPIQEWHSNGKKRILTSYKKIDVSPTMFDRAEDYREYSLD